MNMKTVISSACVAAATAAHATAPPPSPEDYAHGILLCGASAAFARFSVTMGDTGEDLALQLGQVGCIKRLDHKSKAVLAMTDAGVRFQRVGGIKSRLVRIVGADGRVIGHAEYRGYMYAPAQRAAVEAVLAEAK